MRAVIQRVFGAEVKVGSDIVGSIGRGLLVYLGVGKSDSEKDAKFFADKLCGLRIFSDSAGKMNLSVGEVGGEILLVSNFTLYGNCRKGKRPGFDAAAEPGLAERLYEKAAGFITDNGVKVSTGVFGANMQVSSTNDGPVTFVLEVQG